LEVGGQHHAPAALPPGKTRYPLYRKLGRPQGRSGRMRKISPPQGFDPRTAQPVASRYTDYAIPAPLHVYAENMYTAYFRQHFTLIFSNEFILNISISYYILQL
jgi:hypothetical protein